MDGTVLTTYYAAIKWPVAEGPQPRDVANDLQILAMTLIAEHDWSFESVADMLNSAIDAGEAQHMELEFAKEGK